jgi:beta-1,4-mannooligosaccharide/beta-1,4-mannosyl-N-acetylglucosamine phosphorylase
MNQNTAPAFKTHPCITRCPANPILSAKDIPYEAKLVFNAGVTKYAGRYVMVFRDDMRNAASQIVLGLATSADGVHWEVDKKPCFSMRTDEIQCAYDPRLTVIDGQLYMCFVVQTRHGLRGGIAQTEDFEHWDILSLSTPDNRNMVLFSEKLDGKFMRLERPFPIYGRGHPEAFDMWFADSPDCRYWGNSQLVLGSEEVPYANCKIGPGAPPVRTTRGWLAFIHGVWKHTDRQLQSWGEDWRKEYVAGLALLDLEQPWKVTAMSRAAVLVAEAEYEVNGFRGSVIFPGGMILEDSGEVKIYYGAADTVECLATADVGDLLNLCEPLTGRNDKG